jgi:hypothetical protein
VCIDSSAMRETLNELYKYVMTPWHIMVGREHGPGVSPARVESDHKGSPRIICIIIESDPCECHIYIHSSCFRHF